MKSSTRQDRQALPFSRNDAQKPAPCSQRVLLPCFGFRHFRANVQRSNAGSAPIQNMGRIARGLGELALSLAEIASECPLPRDPPHVLDWRAARILALYIRTKVPESEAWKHTALEHGAGFAHRCGRMEALCLSCRVDDLMMFLSHGTQDRYPDFLKEVHKISAAMVANIAMIYNVGAVVGAIIFGHFSQVAGRRKGMIAALGLSLLMIPLWAFAGGLQRSSPLPF